MLELKVPDALLREKGYVSINDQEGLFLHLNTETLRRKGMYQLGEHTKEVLISTNAAAEVVRCDAKTLRKYARLGYIAMNEGGKISLYDALLFDMQRAKADHLKTKVRRNAQASVIINRRNRRA